MDASRTRQRIEALDLLRGLFILLACLQHFTGFINHWFPPHVAPPARLAIDDTLHFIIWTLTPAGDHLFLALAAFNLANRTREDFQEVFGRKLGFYGVLFLFFLFEPFFVEQDLGHALTFGPLLAWMIILATLAVLHRLWGPRGVLGAFVLHLALQLVEMREINDAIEAGGRELLALPSWRYETRLDLFFGSGATAFLLGYWYHHGPREVGWRLKQAIGVLTLALMPWVLFGTWWTVDRAQIWHEEYAVAETTLGLVAIWCINGLSIAVLLLAEHRWRPMWLPIVNWCGLASLLAFAMHRVVFAHVLAPLRDYVAVRWDLPVSASILEILIFIAGTLIAVRVVQRTRVLALLDR